MTDIPIIFSAPMVMALLQEAEEAGTGKSMTRRLAWWKKIKTERKTGRHLGNKVVPSPWRKVVAGDRLWVRECAMHNGGSVCYRADGDMARIKWRPSIHMPRAWSRLTLVVSAVKSELLKDISEQDCEREGCVWDTGLQVWNIRGASLPSGAPIANARARDAFAALWDTINGSGAWLANPEVVAVSFKVYAQNIDALKVAA